ncbi:MAG: preprotein translocase subunit YajC [Brumimicrobium sp.]|nr:preprotein translocase subunit YajC [Brumimicrobium sp.]MCO5268034.1 preprotein translocase subunit YajC [Brumimicrobium sp.]
MGQGGSQLIMLVLILGVFYFLMIRPQMKKQKELKKFREGLAVGDKVVTIGGLHGKILEIGDTNVLLSCEGSSKIRVEKSAISTGIDEQQLASTDK